MKKIIVIFLLPIFLLSTTIGVTMTSIYCKGKLSKTGINVKPCCANINQKGCCKSEVKLVKVKDDFLKTSATFKLNKSLLYTSVPVSFIVNFKRDFQYQYKWDKAPPVKPDPIYLLLHSFLI